MDDEKCTSNMIYPNDLKPNILQLVKNEYEEEWSNLALEYDEFIILCSLFVE